MMKRRILSIALTLCMLLTVMPVAAFADEKPTWTWDSYTGTLTISGKGKVSDEFSDIPMNVLEHTLRNLVFDEGVSNIDVSFSYCGGLRSVTFLGDITSLYIDAFQECSKLDSVYCFGDFIAYSDEAFISCPSNLKFYCYTDSDVYVPDGFTKAPLNGTCGATDSDDVTWRFTSDGTLTISGTGAMADYTVGNYNGSITSDDRPWKDLIGMIKKVVIEDGVTAIGKHAFCECKSLTNVDFSDSVSVIGEWAFLNCTSLMSVGILGDIQNIGVSAFNNCTALKSVVIYGNVNNISTYAFADCNNSLNMYIWGDIQSIEKLAFCKEVFGSELPPLDNVTIYSSKASVEKAFKAAGYSSFNFVSMNGECGSPVASDVTWRFSSDGTLTISGTGAMDVSQPWEGLRDLITNVVIEEGITSIGYGAFEGYPKLTKVEIFGIVIINRYAFKDCKSLKGVYFFGDETTQFGKDVFENASEDFTMYSYIRNPDVKKFCKMNGFSFVALDGECGYWSGATNAMWKLSPDGTLNITGEGDMRKIDEWAKFAENGDLKRVVIDGDINYTDLGITPKYTVTIKDGDKALKTYMFLYDGEKVPKPSDLTKTGLTFCGWYEEAGKFDFDTVITKDITLFAKFECTGHRDEKPLDHKCDICGEALHEGLLGWQFENGKYWQKCFECDYETAKKDIPEITINGADKVCVTEDYVFSFTLPEGSKNAQYGYSYEKVGSGSIPAEYKNGMYYGRVSASSYPEGEKTFRAFVIAETEDGFEYSVGKTVTVVFEHTDDNGDDKCDICGKNLILYGDVNGDGEVNPSDVVQLRRYFANYDSETGKSTIPIDRAADVNGDGEINPSDVVLLRRYFANYNSTTGESTIVLGK